MPTRLWVSYNCQAVYDIPEGINLNDTSQVKSYRSECDELTIKLVNGTSLKIKTKHGYVHNLYDPTHYSEEEIDSDDEDDEDSDDEEMSPTEELIAGYKDTIADYEDIIADHEDSLENNSLFIDKLQSELDEKKERIDEYEDMVASKDKQIQDLLKKNAEQYKHIMELLQTIHGSQ